MSDSETGGSDRGIHGECDELNGTTEVIQLRKEYSVTVPNPSGLSVVGVEQFEGGPSTLEEAKQDGGARFFRDVLGIKSGADVISSTERDAPERTYRVDGNTLYCRLSEPGFSLELRVPFNETQRSLHTDSGTP